MGYINQPPDLRIMFDDIYKRLRLLETATRFTAPDVATEPTYPRTGDIIYLNPNGYLEYWNGTEWVVITDNNTSPPKIAFTSTWSGTGLAYTGTPATGYYIKIGKMIFFTINVNCTNVTNFGTGNYSLTLPFAPDNDYITQNGGIHKTTNHYVIAGDLESGSTSLPLYYVSNNGTNSPMDYNHPVLLTTASKFYISGTYFVP